MDVGLVVRLDPEAVPALARELGGAFYADEAMMREALSAGRAFRRSAIPFRVRSSSAAGPPNTWICGSPSWAPRLGVVDVLERLLASP
jgi:hypothetical protein